jgi:hypothetical protein
MSKDQASDPAKARWCKDHQQFAHPNLQGEYVCSGKPERGEGQHVLPEKAADTRLKSSYSY